MKKDGTVLPEFKSVQNFTRGPKQVFNNQPLVEYLFSRQNKGEVRYLLVKAVYLKLKDHSPSDPEEDYILVLENQDIVQSVAGSQETTENSEAVVSNAEFPHF